MRAGWRIRTYQEKKDHEIKMTEAAVRGDHDDHDGGGGGGGVARHRAQNP